MISRTFMDTYLIILFILTFVYAAGLWYLSNGFNQIKKQGRTDSKPMVSVIVSAHNEETHLPGCLECLQAQEYPPEKVEFLIVDDRSTDATGAVTDRFAEQDTRFRPISIKDRRPDFAPKKRAIDTAIRHARGEVILLTDADGRPGPNWVSGIVSYFTEQTDMVIGYAPYTVKPAGHFTKSLLALEYLSHAAVAAATCGLGFPVTCVGTNMGYRKKLYTEIGGFGEYKPFISGDDDLFLTRVREAKQYTIRYADTPDTHVYNDPPQLWSKFLHQRMRYASKGFSYPKKVTAGLLAYYLFNLFMLVGLLGFLFVPTVFYPVLAAYGIKSVAEFYFINLAGKTLHDTRFISRIPLVQVLHIPYVVVFGFLGQFKRFRWAEAHSEAAVQKMA